MNLATMVNHFCKQPFFQLKVSSLIYFIVCVFAAWGIHVVGQVTFPSQNTVPFVIRSTITLTVDVLLAYVSIALLKQNAIQATAFGLKPARIAVKGFLIGVSVGIIAILVIGVLLYSILPFHFVYSRLGVSQILKDSVYYVLGTTLEELIFRGFIFVVLSQLVGWCWSAIILAIPFGLFHLQWTHLDIDGLKLFTTTACYSFIFSFSFILCRSICAAISSHVASNILLHSITGLDGAHHALFVPVFHKQMSVSFDLSFVVLLVSTVIIIAVLLLILRRTMPDLFGKIVVLPS